MTSPFSTYIERYCQGHWRTPIFRDMLLNELPHLPDNPTLLDIGCGDGFDGEEEIQQILAEKAGTYIGIEPDAAMPLGAYFDQTYRCTFEDASLEPGTVDLAFAVMVLEHLPDPEVFWEKLWKILAEGGVFWGFTVDARHWFCHASMWLKQLRIKDLYLHRFLRHEEEDQYQNYPVFYKANTPSQVIPFVRKFRRCDFVNFGKVGQLDYYLPSWLRPLSARLDKSLLARRKPGAILAVRVKK